MTRSEMLADQFGPDLLVMDGYDTAILGVVSRYGQEDIVVYDYNEILRISVDNGMTFDEAVEFFEYNQLGAWMGDRTPCFMKRI